MPIFLGSEPDHDRTAGVRFAIIDDVLSQAGTSKADLVKTTCWTSDESHRAEFIQSNREQCAPGAYPARLTMPAGLQGNCRVAIEAVAHRLY